MSASGTPYFPTNYNALGATKPTALESTISLTIVLTHDAAKHHSFSAAVIVSEPDTDATALKSALLPANSTAVETTPQHSHRRTLHAAYHAAITSSQSTANILPVDATILAAIPSAHDATLRAAFSHS